MTFIFQTEANEMHIRNQSPSSRRPCYGSYCAIPNASALPSQSVSSATLDASEVVAPTSHSRQTKATQAELVTSASSTSSSSSSSSSKYNQITSKTNN
eukprot:5441371-Amphidinium_carterae.1